MKSKAEEHIHTYVRFKGYGTGNFYRCIAPDCNHYRVREGCIGKRNLCSFCGKQMILTREDLKRARPRCINCSNTKEAKLHREGDLIKTAFVTYALPFLQKNENE